MPCSPLPQVLVAVFILSIGLVLHLACRPYQHDILHFMESLAQVTIIVSFYLRYGGGLYSSQ